MPFRRKHNARNMEVVEPNIGSPRLMNVKLNVGGHYFTTSLQTLTKDRNSMLGVMFSEKFDMKPAEDGAFFYRPRWNSLPLYTQLSSHWKINFA